MTPAQPPSEAEAAGGAPAAVPTEAPKCGGEGDDAAGAAVRGAELMPFDDGSLTADKAQSSAMSLVINYAEPPLAAGTAVFGLGLVVLPLLARLNELEERIFAYERHSEMNRNQKLRLFTEAELRQRFGLLDPDFIRGDLTRSTDELDEYISGMGMDAVDAEISKMQKWRDSANANLKGLQKRSALAFLGLPPEANESDINKMYKKMALELHPDKGGDPEKFQELQEMKERLTELEADEKKTDEEKEDEEALKAKEKEKEEEEAKQKLAPDERIKKLRMDVHDTTVRLWERAKKSRDEIIGEKALKANAEPSLNILRLFVERFVNSEIKTLRHDDVKGADSKFRKFVKQGAEIIAVAALHDVQRTLQTIAMQFNYRLIARSGSPEVKSRCQALMEAISEVPAQAEAFLKRLEDMLADNREQEKRRKEEKAREQREREARGDFSGEAGAPSARAAQTPATSSEARPAAPGAAAADGGSRQAGSDPFSDFDFEPAPREKVPDAAKPWAGAQSQTLAKQRDDSHRAVSAAVQQPRTCWDPNFDHPYAGALKSNGSGIYCRPCQRWVNTSDFNVEVFFTHVERVHPRPPLGWPG